MTLDLPLAWAAIIALGVMMYVVMDGFDLGVGIIFPLASSDDERDFMMNSIAPVWDGNETWLVLGGAAMLAAFPVAYSVLLTAFYIPLILMLVGLIFRGVALEFRLKTAPGGRRLWDAVFVLGSYVATFAQGVTLGAYVIGVPTTNGVYAGGDWGWVGLFPLFTGFGLVIAYAALGSTWLIMKTDGRLQDKMYLVAKRLAWILVCIIKVISVWTPIAVPRIAERWFDPANLPWFAPVPVLVLVSTIVLHRQLKARAQVTPILLTLGLVFLCYSGLCISVWPNIVPPSISIWSAAGPGRSMSFAIVGAVVVIPIILAYMAFGYWVFRGKVRAGTEYH